MQDITGFLYICKKLIHMKLFKVTIDNNLGGWKSGEDPSVLVPANDVEGAIQKVIDGWVEDYDFKNRCYIYKKGTNEFSHIRKDSRLSGMEIKFDGYDIHIKNPRKAKLDRINKNTENDK